MMGTNPHRQDSPSRTGLSTPRLEAALSYAHISWHVFPLAPGQKVPRAGSRGHLEATTDEGQIRKWWQHEPGANIGAAMGPSGLITVDVDPQGIELWRDLRGELGIDDRTITQLTPRAGLHLVYAAPKGQKVTGGAAKLGEGIDIRAVGQYIVVWPSVLVNGKGYKWEIGYSPFDMAPLPFPTVLVERLARGGRPPLVLPLVVPEGQRNAVLFRLACAMRSKGMELPGIQAALMAENVGRCQTPLPDQEVETIAKSVLRYPPGNGAQKSPAPKPRAHRRIPTFVVGD